MTRGKLPSRKWVRILKRGAILGSVLIVLIAATIALLMYTRTITIWRWSRESPLRNPLAVKSVSNGTLTLGDGRTLTVAGVRRRDTVTIEDYDFALRSAAVQGILIDRDAGNGRAFLRAEPKFYNWCGTGNYEWGLGWAGSYLQVTLSEFLVYAGYAEIDSSAPELSSRDRWRMEVARQLALLMDGSTISPMRIVEPGEFRYDSYAEYFRSYPELDEAIELNWKAPPKD